MTHNDLISEVAHQLSTRFNPSMTMIKKRIEGLIDVSASARCRWSPRGGIPWIVWYGSELTDRESISSGWAISRRTDTSRKIRGGVFCDQSAMCYGRARCRWECHLGGQCRALIHVPSLYAYFIMTTGRRRGSLRRSIVQLHGARAFDTQHWYCMCSRRPRLVLFEIDRHASDNRYILMALYASKSKPAGVLQSDELSALYAPTLGRIVCHPKSRSKPARQCSV